MSDFGSSVNISASSGVYSDFWLDQTALIVFDVAPDFGLEVQIWIPDASDDEQGAESRKLYFISDGETTELEQPEPGTVFSVSLATTEPGQGPKLWIGTSFWRLLYDQDADKKARRVATRIHAVKQIPAQK